MVFTLGPVVFDNYVVGILVHKVAVYLFFVGPSWAGIFMLLWGFFLISSVDNVVKPLLISQGSNLPFILVLFGVMGGVLAFGFVGVFIGPTLLAVGLSLIQEWLARERVD